MEIFCISNLSNWWWYTIIQDISKKRRWCIFIWTIFLIKIYFNLEKDCVLFLKYRVVVGSLLSNPYFGAKNQNCSFFKTNSLEDNFFWTRNFHKNLKFYGEKVLKSFLTLKKHFFFRKLFMKKCFLEFWKIF